MSNPDIQYFAVSGTWVKPAGAVRVDVVILGGFGRFGGTHLGELLNPNGYGGFDGEPGEIRAASFDADDLPEAVEVTPGKGGMPGGRDGYALIVTHLAPPSLPSVPPHDLMLHAHSHGHPDDGERHEHLHTGPGHMGLEHIHPHRHAPGEQ